MNRTLKWVIVGFLSVFFALFLVGILKITIDFRRNSREMDTLKHADHARLLAACREMIANWKSYGKVNPLAWNSENAVRIVPPIPDNVPLAVRELNPDNILISTNCVTIYLGRGLLPPRLFLLAFRKDARQYGTFNYIDGLWFWNGNTNTNEMQRINGTNF